MKAKEFVELAETLNSLDEEDPDEVPSFLFATAHKRDDGTDVKIVSALTEHELKMLVLGLFARTVDDDLVEAMELLNAMLDYLKKARFTTEENSTIQ